MLLKPITSEKAVAGIELGNRMWFSVDTKATKKEIKAEAEKQFNEKIDSVNTSHTIDGKKKAIITFKRKGAAADVASKLKLA